MKKLGKLLLVLALAFSLAACGGGGGGGSTTAAEPDPTPTEPEPTDPDPDPDPVVYTGSVKFGMSVVKRTAPSQTDSSNSSLLLSETQEDEDTLQPDKLALSYRVEGSTNEPTQVIYPLKLVDGKYFSDGSLQLIAGNYELTKFNILDSTDSIIYMAPEKDAPIATSLDITTTLPHSFTISKDELTNLVMQVVDAQEVLDPQDIGYEGFGFEVIDYNTFYIKILSRSGTGWGDSEANLTVKDSDGNTINTTELKSTTNRVFVSVSSSYELIVEKESYSKKTFELSEAELQAYYQKALVVKFK